MADLDVTVVYQVDVLLLAWWISKLPMKGLIAIKRIRETMSAFVF
jgi:hypothetical protein